MKSYSRLSFLHQRAEGNYSVDHSLLAFLLPPTEARASATVAETVPRLPYLHICIIKTFVRIWRNIVRRRDEEHNILRQKHSDWTSHMARNTYVSASVLVTMETAAFQSPWQRDRLHALPGGSLCLQQSMHWPLALHHSAGLKRSDYQNLWLSDCTYAEPRLDKRSFHRGKMIRRDDNSFLARATLENG